MIVIQGFDATCPCGRCGNDVTVEVESRVLASDWDDIQEAIEIQQSIDGWVNGDCPACDATRPRKPEREHDPD